MFTRLLVSALCLAVVSCVATTPPEAPRQDPKTFTCDSAPACDALVKKWEAEAERCVGADCNYARRAMDYAKKARSNYEETQNPAPSNDDGDRVGQEMSSDADAAEAKAKAKKESDAKAKGCTVVDGEIRCPVKIQKAPAKVLIPCEELHQPGCPD